MPLSIRNNDVTFTLFLIFLISPFTLAQPDDHDTSLFQPSNLYSVLGPTRFPKPTDIISKDAIPVLEPTFGQHRSNKDAVMAYAEGYDLVHYIIFIQTLLETGFDGDIVLAVSALENLENDVEEYLRSCQQCVIYAINFRCAKDGLETERMSDNGGKMSFQMCKLDNIYGELPDKVPLPDPRGHRVVATSRYELYYIWTTHYDSHSWLMLLDARDAYFQLDPFQHLPRSTGSSGQLYFFGENTNTTRLGKSPKNRKWLERAYSKGVINMLQDKPTICSGTTMGEKIALEAYLQAMVSEWDDTHILMKGADQGFHNYLYWSNKLVNVEEIRSITVFEQGRGIINNLGALRDFKLNDLIGRNAETGEEVRLYNMEDRRVYNWNGVLSPVVHQWDRDRMMYHYTMNKRFPALLQWWNETKFAKHRS